jgi:phenylalanine-4-hydroxylase
MSDSHSAAHPDQDESMGGAAVEVGNGLPEFLTQDYAKYTQEDHDTWKMLYSRRMDSLKDNGSEIYLSGARLIGLEPNKLPNLNDVNARLAARTGWAAVGVGGFMPPVVFFRCLAARRFPTTLTIRPRAKLDYLPEPDIFHDVFGHVPLHADPVFADFLQHFGALAAVSPGEKETEEMARLFWFTVEFGLIKEAGRTKVYGSGLISSHGDAANALGPNCDRRPFDLDAVIAQPYEIDRMQDVLFVVDSFEQLFAAVETIATRRRVSA